MKKIIYIFLILICIAVLAYNAYTIVFWMIDNKNNSKEFDEISQVAELREIEDTENVEFINPPADEADNYWEYVKQPLLDVSIDELLKVNPDTVGYINVLGTDIDYPVVQAKDNQYYLTHSFKRETSKAGWVFADYQNNMIDLNKNTVIYGHNRLDKAQFGTLKNVLKSNWLNDKNNYIVKMSTVKENTLWQVFSVYSISAENYYITKEFKNDEEYTGWIKTALERSVYDFNTTVDKNDKVLTLSTCQSNNNKVRIVLQAKLIKKAAR